MSRLLIALSVVTLSVSSMSVAAEKKPAIGNFPFWSAPKREYADQFVPGLNASLLLTPEQIEQLHQARRETIDSDALRTIARKDPNISDAQREAAQKKSAEAHAELRVKVSNILTADQRSLIERVNAAHLEVSKSVNEEFSSKLAASKGNDDLQATLRKEMKERHDSDFRSRLEGLFSPAQKSAYDQAAADETATASKPKK